MVFNRRTIYVGSILLWISYGLIFPVWIGRGYGPHIFNDGVKPNNAEIWFDGQKIDDSYRPKKRWVRSGTFGLSHEHVANGNPFAAFLFLNRLSSNRFDLVQAPIWSPPPQVGGGIPPSVRWPWQGPSQNQHVEISIMILFIQWSVGIVAIGFVYRITSWIRPSGTPDALLSVWWLVALFLVFSYVCLFVLAVVSMGYAVTESVVTGGLSVGAMAGLLLGLGLQLRRHSQQKTAPTTSRTNSTSD
jgi:small-conductance mechanosensitive channel